MFFSFSRNAIKRINKPIIGINIRKYNRPDLFVSCSFLIDKRYDRDNKNNTKESKKKKAHKVIVYSTAGI